MRWAWLVLVAAGLSAAEAPTYFSVPGADAPELAKRGAFSVGVRTISLVHKHQIDIAHVDARTKQASYYDRPLPVEIWYPASIPPEQVESTMYESAMPGTPRPGRPATFTIAGKALRNAAPVKGQRFPLVIVSHGYPGSRTFLSYLTENLASKGYVVAAIDHTDSVFGAQGAFPSTLVNRSPDQLFTIESLRSMEGDGESFLHGLVDARNVAIVGYSMGGYGALISAGAGLSKTGMVGKAVPSGYADDLMAESAGYKSVDRSAVRAIVAIAPWGKQPPYSVWDAKGLAGIRVPSLFIAGDHDDVADYAQGIKPAFEQAVNSERYLLVYDEARHNTGANPPPPGMELDYGLTQTFDEPVWRKERICAINQHFITAFLDWKLKGNESRKRFLEIPVAKSDDGEWQGTANARDEGGFSAGRDEAGNAFWPGFQRRWALGLEWFHAAAGDNGRGAPNTTTQQ